MDTCKHTCYGLIELSGEEKSMHGGLRIIGTIGMAGEVMKALDYIYNCCIDYYNSYIEGWKAYKPVTA